MKKLIAVVLALVSVVSMGDSESLTVGANFSAQGCVDAMGTEATKSVHVTYQKTTDNFDVEAYAKRAPRGADCREDGVTLNLNVERKFDVSELGFVTLNLGYVQHGVTGFDRENTLVFGSVKQEIASFGIGRTIAGFEVDVSWNVPTNKPRFAVETTVKNVELSWDTSAGFTNAVASYTIDLNEEWGLNVTARHSSGFDKLPDPFGGKADAPATNEANTLDVGVRYEF